MGDEKPHDESGPDPWADLLGDGPGESAEEFSFSFDEPAEVTPSAAAEPSEPDAATEPEADPDAALMPAAADLPPADGDVEPQLDDEQAAAWLDDVESSAAAEPEADAGGSSIEIGTGRSGIVASDEVDAWGDVGPADDPQPSEADTSGDSFSFDDPEPAVGEGVAEEGIAFAEEAAAEEAAFPGIDAGVEDAAVGLAGATVAAATAAGGKAGKIAKPAKAKKGGIGQMIGVVLGGALSIPIVFGILIGLMWAGVTVPVGKSIGRALPESMAFIVPEKFRPGFKRSAVAVAAPGKRASLDELGTGQPQAGDESATEESPAEPMDGAIDVGSLPLDEPEAGDADTPVVDDEPVVPGGDGDSFADPLAAAAEPEMKPDEAAPDDASIEAAKVAAADRKQLDAAVQEALTAVDALEEVADAEDPARKKLLVDLYKALATVGVELVMLEKMSADSGRPLTEPPLSLNELHERLPRHGDDLQRLGRNWLDFTKRPSDGVVLPVTIQSSRKIGPNWSSKVTLPLAKGGVREIVVLSRTEPAAVAGDLVLVIGTLFDGDVIWAADVRPLGNPGDGGGAGERL
ncbi:MAG: hypothetical protein ACKOC4_11960 [Planctomycetia bacterium]